MSGEDDGFTEVTSRKKGRSYRTELLIESHTDSVVKSKDEVIDVVALEATLTRYTCLSPLHVHDKKWNWSIGIQKTPEAFAVSAVLAHKCFSREWRVKCISFIMALGLSRFRPTFVTQIIVSIGSVLVVERKVACLDLWPSFIDCGIHFFRRGVCSTSSAHWEGPTIAQGCNAHDVLYATLSVGFDQWHDVCVFANGDKANSALYRQRAIQAQNEVYIAILAHVKMMTADEKENKCRSTQKGLPFADHGARNKRMERTLCHTFWLVRSMWRCLVWLCYLICCTRPFRRRSILIKKISFYATWLPVLRCRKFVVKS